MKAGLCGYPQRASRGVTATHEPRRGLDRELIEDFLVGIVEHVPDEAVIDPQTIAKFMGREDNVAQFLADFRFKALDDRREFIAIQLVPHDKKVDAALPILEEPPGDDDQAQIPRAGKPLEQVFMVDRCIEEKVLQFGAVLEIGIEYEPRHTGA